MANQNELWPVENTATDRDGNYLSNLSLQIQLAATGVATSFVLIFIPNVETISFTAFLVGFLFPIQFALVTILTMTFTWEILASMVFGFSGITFPFKVVAWLLIGFLGVFARKIGSKYFYEFAIFGAISAFLFDIIVSVSTALFFLNNLGSFITVLVANLLIGFLFSLSHTVSNAILFSFIPVILRAILPLVQQSYSYLLMVDIHKFDYLKTSDIRNSPVKILKLDIPRLSAYSAIAVLISISLVIAGFNYAQTGPIQPEDGEDVIAVDLVINYDGVKSLETHNLTINYNLTVLEITQQVAVVNYTTQFGGIPYIQAINGVWQNQDLANHYWLLFVNGDFVNTAASQTYVVQGDVVSWQYSD